MDDRDAPDELGGRHPGLRSVTPPECPYPGTLRRVGDETRLFVDVADFAGALSWTCDPAGHVLAPLDVARRRDGHDVVLPRCFERVDDLLARRGTATPLADGEIVTLAVSLRRGLAELLGVGVDCPAEWWITDDGRPVLACAAEGGASGSAGPVGMRATSATEATASILAEARRQGSPAVAGALDALSEATVHPRALSRDADLLEAALFQAADPLPIERETSPRRSSLAGLVPERREPDEPESDRWEELLRGHLDGELVDLAAAALRSVRRRIGRRRPAGQSSGGPSRRSRSGAPGCDEDRERPRRGPDHAPPRRRGTPWLIAGCLGAAVIAAGLLWPSTDSQNSAGAVVLGAATGPGETETATGGATGEDAAGDPPGSSTPSESNPSSAGDAPATDPSDEPDGSASDDPVAVVADILDAAARCGDDVSCAATLVEDPSGPTAERLIGLVSHSDEPELVDAFGGAAVVRVAHDGSSSLVVVVQATTRGEGWLVRDVYDVADQP